MTTPVVWVPLNQHPLSSTGTVLPVLPRFSQVKTHTDDLINFISGYLWCIKKRTGEKSEGRSWRIFPGYRIDIGLICAMVRSRYIGDGHPTF